MLDLKKLKYLTAIYKYGSFTQASKELYVSQPAISAAITSLEKQLGVELLTRNSKNVNFTAAGERFIIYAQHILQECEKAEQDMKYMSQTYAQTLRLGLSPSLSHYLLPYLYETFFSSRKQAQIQIFEGTMSNHISMIRDGSLDLTYNALPNSPIKDIETIKITSAQVYAILPKKHKLAAYPKINIEMLNGESVSLPDKNSKIYPLMMQEFQKKGVVPRTISNHEQIICMFDMVKYGNYICFANRDAYQPLLDENSDIVARPMSEPIQFDIGFIMNKSTPMPKIGQELIEYTRNTTDKWLNHED